jgi:hypothetical protein
VFIHVHTPTAIGQQHQKDFESARKVCEEAVADPSVAGADRLEIAKRLERLLSKVSLHDSRLAYHVCSISRISYFITVFGNGFDSFFLGFKGLCHVAYCFDSVC